jgi:hypothetical protein
VESYEKEKEEVKMEGRSLVDVFINISLFTPQPEWLWGPPNFPYSLN